LLDLYHDLVFLRLRFGNLLNDIGFRLLFRIRLGMVFGNIVEPSRI